MKCRHLLALQVSAESIIGGPRPESELRGPHPLNPHHDIPTIECNRHVVIQAMIFERSAHSSYEISRCLLGHFE